MTTATASREWHLERGARRARALGLERQWKKLPVTVRSRLVGVFTDGGFKEAVEFVAVSQLTGEEVANLVKLLNKTRSEVTQQSVVRQQFAAHKEAIQATGGRTLRRSRRGHVPSALFGAHLAYLRRAEHHEALLAMSMTEQEKKQLASICYEVAESLLNLAERLNVG
jgi:hypothetical protein